MQPIATPSELIDNLRRELETIMRTEVAAYNGRGSNGQTPDVEYLVHPDGRVRLMSRSRPLTLLIEIAADELAINIVVATGQAARAGYPKQVPLKIAVEGK